MKNRQRSFSGIFILVLTVLILTSLFLWIKVLNVSKFAFVNKTKDGGGEIVIIDRNKITKYKIGPETLFVSARGFGEYKLSSLWILGQKEGLGGKLVSESITTNFLIPLYLWKDGKDTNLSFFQKIKVIVSNMEDDNYEKDLTSFSLPNSVRINFINHYIQEEGILTEVHDLTGNTETITRVSLVIEALGTKISGYNKGYDKDLDCEVMGFKTEAVKLLSKVFDCKILETKETDSSLKIRLGAKFAERF